MNKQNGKGPRDIENKLMVTKGVGDGNKIFLNEINLVMIYISYDFMSNNNGYL